MSSDMTSVISNEINAIKACLSSTFSSFRVMEEFEYRQAAALSVATLTVGVASFRSSVRWLSNNAGYQQNQLCHGVPYEVDYEVTIHSPLSEGGSAGRWLMTRVVDVLRTEPTLHFAGITAGAIRYDRARRCLCLPLTLTAHYIL